MRYALGPGRARGESPDPDYEGSELLAVTRGLTSSYQRLLRRARQASEEPRSDTGVKLPPWRCTAGAPSTAQDRLIDEDEDADSDTSASSGSSSSIDGQESTSAPKGTTPRRRRWREQQHLTWATIGDEDASVQALHLALEHSSPESLRARGPTAPGKTSATGRTDDDLASIQQMLGSMRLVRKKEEEELQRDFEARKKHLWDDIEKSIKYAEAESKKAAEEEAARLRAMRERQEQQEKAAAAAREREKAKVEAERAAQAEAEKAKQEQQAAEQQRKDAEAQRLSEENAREARRTGSSREARSDYEHWRGEMKMIKEKMLTAVAANPMWKKQCFEAKRKITPKIGQLTNSRQEITRITVAIGEVLEAAKGTGSQEIYVWILNHLSKCLIRQAEQEVAAKQDSAYPLAQVVSWLLLMGHEELGRVLMSRLVKKCCWCIGFIPAREAGQDDAAYSKVIGRKSPDEASGAFVDRLCGIFAFYAALLQIDPSPPPGAGAAIQPERIPAQFRSAAMWKWAVRALNPPLVDQTLAPSLWSTFLEVAGAAYLQAYGRQAAKVLSLLQQDAVNGKKAKWATLSECESSTIRLNLLLEQWRKDGMISRARSANMEP